MTLGALKPASVMVPKLTATLSCKHEKEEQETKKSELPKMDKKVFLKREELSTALAVECSSPYI